jgi:hypothetical protein
MSLNNYVTYQRDSKRKMPTDWPTDYKRFTQYKVIKLKNIHSDIRNE